MSAKSIFAETLAKILPKFVIFNLNLLLWTMDLLRVGKYSSVLMFKQAIFTKKTKNYPSPVRRGVLAIYPF